MWDFLYRIKYFSFVPLMPLTVLLLSPHPSSQGQGLLSGRWEAYEHWGPEVKGCVTSRVDWLLPAPKFTLAWSWGASWVETCLTEGPVPCRQLLGVFTPEETGHVVHVVHGVLFRRGALCLIPPQITCRWGDWVSERKQVMKVEFRLRCECAQVTQSCTNI